MPLPPQTSSSSLPQHAIDSFGLSGVDRLISFMLVRDLQAIVVQYQLLYTKDRSFADAVKGLQLAAAPLSGLLGEFVRVPAPLLFRSHSQGWSAEIPAAFANLRLSVKASEKRL